MGRSQESQAEVGSGQGAAAGESVQDGESPWIGAGGRSNQTGNKLLLSVCRSMSEPSPHHKSKQEKVVEAKALSEPACFLNILGSEKNYRATSKTKTAFVFTLFHLSLLGFTGRYSKVTDLRLGSPGPRMLLCSERSGNRKYVLEGLLNPLNLWLPKQNNMSQSQKLC